MTFHKNQTISECVATNYQTATVFKKYKIDFCCGGKISIQDACKKNNIEEEILLQELNKAIEQELQENPAEAFELDDLAEYIVEKHHTYIRNRIPEIEPFLEKIVSVHGERHPELKKVQENFQAVKEELLSHMKKEENILFPFIKEMVKAKKTNATLTLLSCGSIKNPINMMELEHESAGDTFKEIREITDDLSPPEGACNTYRTTFALLDEFENDLHRHIHLENNVLFPKAILLEEALL